MGADDYVTKPFSAREIVARVRAVLRRAQTAAMHDDVVRVGDSIVLDAPRMQVQVDGRDVLLTATEFQLLLHMARQPGRVFTRAQLLDAVHGVAVESYERAIDAHVKNIRRKIEQDPRSPRHLQTVFGVGYRLVDGDAMSSGPPWGRGGGGRPPWWPEGDAAPWSGGPNWRRHGRRIARRIGCFVGVVLLVVLSAIFGVVWLLLSAFGAVSSAPFDTAVAVTALVLGGARDRGGDPRAPPPRGAGRRADRGRAPHRGRRSLRARAGARTRRTCVRSRAP